MLPVLDGELVILSAVKLSSVSCAVLQEKRYTCVWSRHMHKVNCLIKWWWVLKYLWNIWCQIKWHWLLFFFLVETATALSVNSLLSLRTRCWSLECWFICVWLPWWKAVIFCLCCPQDGSALSTGWIFPFAQVQFACIYPQSHLQPLDDWKEQYDFCITALATCYFFTSAAPRVGTTLALDQWVVPTLIRGTCFNPSLGPPNLAGSGWPLGKSPPPGPGAAHQLGQGCHRGCGPSNTAQGVLQPFRLCSLRAWRFCIPGRLADWHQENQVCMASEAVATTCLSSYPIRTQSGEWQQEWSRTKVTDVTAVLWIPRDHQTPPSLGMLVRSWEDCVGNDRWMKLEYIALLRSSRGHRWLC